MNSHILLEEILTSTKGQCLSQHQNQFLGVGTDTRKNLSGQIFIALAGDQFDAHNFLEKAVEQKASALIISKMTPAIENLKSKVTIIKVDDTLRALQNLATFRRLQSKAKVIAMTGSNGKTTTKEFTAALLSPYFKVHYNQGSFNNHWGVPLTLLELQPEHQIVISEMGMNHPGEITELVHIAQPNIIGVTMVGRAHLEGLGTIEAVSLAKEEIYKSTENPSHGIFNLDNPWTQKMKIHFLEQHKKATTVSFSEIDPGADIYLQITDFNIDSFVVTGHIKEIKKSCRLEIFGKHNITNLMAAIGFALAAGLSPEQVWQALPQCKSIWGRNQKLKLQNGATIIFDAYNANPDSQKALIDNIRAIQVKENQKIIGIFGDMRELGEHSCPLHEELGELISTAPFDIVWFIGAHSEYTKKGFLKNNKTLKKTQIYQTQEVDQPICVELKKSINPQDLIVIKGSRGMKLEKVLDYFDVINKK